MTGCPAVLSWFTALAGHLRDVHGYIAGGNRRVEDGRVSWGHTTASPERNGAPTVAALAHHLCRACRKRVCGDGVHVPPVVAACAD